MKEQNKNINDNNANKVIIITIRNPKLSKENTVFLYAPKIIFAENGNNNNIINTKTTENKRNHPFGI